MRTTHLTARAVAVLASGLLALGLAQAPSPAAPSAVPSAAGRATADDGPSVSQLRDLAATLRPGDADDDSVGHRVARRVAVVRDPRGDARRFDAAGRGPRPYTRLADVTRLRYKTPSRVVGDLRVTSRWADLRDARRPGVRRQYQVTFLLGRDLEDTWVVETSNAHDRVLVGRLGEDDFTRVRPEEVSLEKSYGPGGAIDLLLSSEWLDTSRVRIGTFVVSGQGEAYDETDLSRRLDVGPVAR